MIRFCCKKNYGTPTFLLQDSIIQEQRKKSLGWHLVSCVNTKTYCSKRSEDKLEGGGSLKVFDSGFAKPQEAVLAELVVVPNLKGDMVNMC